MLPYQEEYLSLLRSASKNTGPLAQGQSLNDFLSAASEANRISCEAIERGTGLLRDNLFPLLDNILSASDEDIDALYEFAGSLMNGVSQTDVGLSYRIHLSLLSYARHKGLRDMLIRELYFTAMALYNLETMLSPNNIRLYAVRMRMYFTEAASYFEKDYDSITDPETRGYIHRSMGNIALSYSATQPEDAKRKLDAITRSINILSDPDVQAKTPSLPWSLFLYKSHQERTALLGYLRTGSADHIAFAQVLESAQIVQDKQIKAARSRGEQLQPRWQYAYLAARYHCGALLLQELLDGLYSMSSYCRDDDFGSQSMFTHLSVPAVYMEYSKYLNKNKRSAGFYSAIQNMTRRLFLWIAKAPNSDENETMMFYLRQFLYTYIETPGGMPFIDVLQNAFAARHPVTYVRMTVAGQIARQLTLWAIEDSPESLIGLNGCGTAEEVIKNKASLADFAETAGRLYDTGMIHFINLEASACRGLFYEEEEIIQLHSHFGAQLLGQHESTEIYRDIALGHHCRFDEKGGYPANFSPSSSPVRQMIYIISVADALASCAEETSSRYRPVHPLSEVLERLDGGEGKLYAPFAVKLIRSPERREALKRRLDEWKHGAYLDMYRRIALMTE